MKNSVCKKGKRVAVILLLSGLLVACGQKDKVEPIKESLELIKESVDVELGEELSLNVEDYVTGENKVLEETVLDTSKVDVTNIGEYEMTITYKEEIKTVIVNVKDTIAPEAHVIEELEITAGEPYGVLETIMDIEEYTNEVMVSVAENQYIPEEESAEVSVEEYASLNGVKCNEVYICYEEAGEYDNKIVLADESGNQSEYEIHITVVDSEEPDQEDDTNDTESDETSDTNENPNPDPNPQPQPPTEYPDWTGPELYKATYVQASGTETIEGGIVEGWFTFYHDQTEQGFSAGIDSSCAIWDEMADEIWAKYPNASKASVSGMNAVVGSVTGPYKNCGIFRPTEDNIKICEIRVPLIVWLREGE